MKRIVFVILVSICQMSIGQECSDVNFKLRGYFYAGSSQVYGTPYGGFYEDNNKPEKLIPEISRYSNSKKLELIARIELKEEFKEGVSGFKVFIINTSDSIIELPVQDSRLYLTRQVFYKSTWRDIEYLPSSWCGNSYHSVYIKPDEYWDFTAPCLKGKINTRVRFKLYINENLEIYSNEFQGSFNKKQLKKEQGHSSLGIMDPYNN